jgi:hypothetical protein
MKYVYWETEIDWARRVLLPVDETIIPLPVPIATIDLKPSYYGEVFGYIYPLEKSLQALRYNVLSSEQGQSIIEDEVKKLGYEVLPDKLRILL